MIPLIPALGVVLGSGIVGACAGSAYGKRPSANRDEVATRVDEWAAFFDRVGPVQAEAGARFAVCLAADMFFRDPGIPSVTPDGLRSLMEMCRKAGIADDVAAVAVRKIFDSRYTNLPHTAA